MKDTYLQRTGVLPDAGLAHLLLALFEPSKIVLYEERGIELADCHIVLFSCSHSKWSMRFTLHRTNYYAEPLWKHCHFRGCPEVAKTLKHWDTRITEPDINGGHSARNIHLLNSSPVQWTIYIGLRHISITGPQVKFGESCPSAFDSEISVYRELTWVPRVPRECHISGKYYCSCVWMKKSMGMAWREWEGMTTHYISPFPTQSNLVSLYVVFVPLERRPALEKSTTQFRHNYVFVIRFSVVFDTKNKLSFVVSLNWFFVSRCTWKTATDAMRY